MKKHVSSKWWLMSVAGLSLSLSMGLAQGARADQAAAETLGTQEVINAELGGTPASEEAWDALSAAVASTAPASDVMALSTPATICSRTPADVQKLAYEPTARISVYNQGGLLDGGVCWWHSRLQRSSLYLAVYRPDLPKATRAQALAIINNLARFAGINVIPGYANFYDFSKDYEHDIIARLESWQKTDGFLHFRWIDGLKGQWHVAPGTLQSIVQAIHRMVNDQHRIVFEKLHFNHVATHAYLIIGSRALAQGAYDLDVIDSNAPGETQTVHYQVGQTSLYTAMGSEPIVPYLDFEGDMGYIRGALAGYCKSQGQPVTLP